MTRGRMRWAVRLLSVDRAKDEKTGEPLFPPGQWRVVDSTNDNGLRFEGTNRAARRAAARSTRRKGR